MFSIVSYYDIEYNNLSTEETPHLILYIIQLRSLYFYKKNCMYSDKKVCTIAVGDIEGFNTEMLHEL